jgi:hypothetical protein
MLNGMYLHSYDILYNIQFVMKSHQIKGGLNHARNASVSVPIQRHPCS